MTSQTQIHIKEVNDTTYLTRKNYFKNSIIVYNWNTKKKIREYKLKSEGPNKVLKFDSAGFLELDKDKFLIANGYSQTYIFDNDSVIHKEYWDDGGRGFGNMMNGFNKNLPVQIENNIYIFRKPPVPRVNIDYYSYNLLVEFDLEKQNLKECLVKYPNSYKVGECWGFPALRQSFTLNNKNQLIFSFPIDHSLYSYSLLDKTFTKILKPTNSSFDIEFKPLALYVLERYWAR